MGSLVFTVGRGRMGVMRCAMAMLLELGVQNLGFVERVLVTGTEKKDGGSGQQQGGGELHEQSVRGGESGGGKLGGKFNLATGVAISGKQKQR